MPAAPEPANTEVTGKVLSVSAGKAILHLTEGRHPASGFEGESEFALGKGDSLIVSPGDTIRGQAVPFGGGYRLERIWPADPVTESIMAGVNRQLRRDTVSRGLNPTLKVGETLPDFALYDQNGKVFQSRFLRGNRVLMNFIFTRLRHANDVPGGNSAHGTAPERSEGGGDQKPETGLHIVRSRIQLSWNSQRICAELRN